jgi:hypothetical protein
VVYDAVDVPNLSAQYFRFADVSPPHETTTSTSDPTRREFAGMVVVATSTAVKNGRDEKASPAKSDPAVPIGRTHVKVFASTQMSDSAIAPAGKDAVGGTKNLNPSNVLAGIPCAVAAIVTESPERVAVAPDTSEARIV